MLCFKCRTSAAPAGDSEESREPMEISGTGNGSAVPSSLPLETHRFPNGTATNNQQAGTQSTRGNSPSPRTSIDELAEDDGLMLMFPGPWRASTIANPPSLPVPEPPPPFAPRRSSRRGVATTETTLPAVDTSNDAPKESGCGAPDMSGAVGPGIRLLAGDTTSGWKAMISCDYCTLSWHLDCVDPPMVCLPPCHKRWMCPNHADHVIVSYRLEVEVTCFS